MMPYDLSDFVIIDLDPDHSKGTHKEPNIVFVYMQKLGYYTLF